MGEAKVNIRDQGGLETSAMSEDGEELEDLISKNANFNCDLMDD